MSLMIDFSSSNHENKARRNRNETAAKQQSPVAKSDANSELADRLTDPITFSTLS